MYGAFQNCLIEKFQIESCKHIQEGEYKGVIHAILLKAWLFNYFIAI